MLCRLKLASFLYSLFAFLWSNAIAVPIPSDIKEVVVFIYIEGPKGELVPNGTGFLVGVEHPRNAERMFPYLVTAKHVLSQTQDVLLPHVFLKPNGPFLPHVFLRLEKKSGALEIIKIPLVPHDAEQNVFLHQDPTVDLAVIPLWLKEDVFAYKIFPENLILSQEKFSELNITEGSDIFFAGLFTPYLGEKKNYPVVRFGHIALITSEKINWNGTMMDLYLIETFSYGGNSGAPIFFYPDSSDL